MSGANSQREKELAEVGEKIASEHLRSKGHTILNRRYRYDRAEVDIVSESGGMLVFTEVKTRESSYLPNRSSWYRSRSNASSSKRPTVT